MGFEKDVLQFFYTFSDRCRIDVGVRRRFTSEGFSVIRAKSLSLFPSPTKELCGVMTAFGSAHSSLSAGSGSCSNTSRAALSRPDLSSLMRASVSIIPAARNIDYDRPVFHRGENFPVGECSVSLVSGRQNIIMSPSLAAAFASSLSDRFYQSRQRRVCGSRR